MGWDGLCGGPMTAVFDHAAEGDRRAAQQAQSVCALCPVQEQCRQQILESPPWPSDEGPSGIIAGSLHRRRRRRPRQRGRLAAIEQVAA